MIFIDDGLRCCVFLHRLDGDGSSMFITSAYKHHIAFLRAQVTYINICRQVGARQVTNMLQAIGIGKGRSNQISFRIESYFCYQHFIFNRHRCVTHFSGNNSIVLFFTTKNTRKSTMNTKFVSFVPSLVFSVVKNDCKNTAIHSKTSPFTQTLIFLSLKP